MPKLSDNQDAAQDPQTAPAAAPTSSNDVPQTQPATDASPVNVAPQPTPETEAAAERNAAAGLASSAVSSAPGDVDTVVPVALLPVAENDAAEAPAPKTKVDADGNVVPAAEVDAKAVAATGKLEGFFFQHLNEELHAEFAKLLADIKAAF